MANGQWPFEEQMVIGKNNVIYTPLVDKEKVILYPLHIYLYLMKQFAKVLNKDGSWFKYTSKKFLELRMDELAAGIFYELQIRKLILDQYFRHSMDSIWFRAW